MKKSLSEVIEEICEAFRQTVYPGDNFLQGSFEGSEPFEMVSPFQGRIDRETLEPEFLDAHAAALSFFSEGALRFFLPAFLIADLNRRLVSADPLFHLTHGFSDRFISVPTARGNFRRLNGKSRLINPRRYGALRAFDHARFRLSVFTHEEAGAIVAYLKYKRDDEADDGAKKEIEAALDLFWLGQGRDAPSLKDLEAHEREEAEFFAAISNSSAACE